MYELKVKLLYSNSKLPEFANDGDAGMDVFSVENKLIKSGESELISIGLVLELPKNTEIQVRPKSGLALNNQLTVLNSPGTIDEGYRGEVKIVIINHGKQDFMIKEGMKIAQLVLKPVYDVRICKVDYINHDTDRGVNGFGSSGIK
ncbi:dUTP diphosphatase [Candidatus Arthromitus sp. SFB-rat-Yit]|uniref:dUTP diphosphatase n=1 Tax=Candidatus Arthromitus sp. SFB-rat-Yit TaxID=1041504 RepID=UPI000227A39D|nr:dUTP diphosphatase [Candidatus Arthromitus sp. SFB-rat-Yit]BAK81498.1 deoxyuridine 5'-triphosphate nucleotidohydrolase Dut [Candidatus Arthromitus sp. SFB-rat-Yit]